MFTKIIIRLAPFLLLSLVTMVVYTNSISNEFVSDDITTIVTNPMITSLEPVKRLWYSFFTPLYTYLIFHFFGPAPWIFRLINIFFHAGTVCVVYLLVRRLLHERTALIASLFTAVHPIFTESVTWISGGIYVRYGFFIVSGLYAYARYMEKRLIRWYFFSIFLFLFSLFNSEKAVIFPLFLLFFEWVYGNLRIYWKGLLIPFFAVVLWLIPNIFRVGTRISDLQTYSYAQPGTWENPILKASGAISTYLELIFWPDRLTIYHSDIFLTLFEAYIRIGFTLLFFIVLFYLIYKHKKVFFWFAFFVMSLIPTMLPLKISWVAAERYVYVGAIGVIIGMSLVIDTFMCNKKYKELVSVGIIFVLIILSIRTLIRNTDWRNHDTLWIATARVSPNSHQNHNNLGDMYARYGKHELAVQEFKRAIELLPNYSDAYHNMGASYLQLGDIENAYVSFSKAIEYNPLLWQSYRNRAAIYLQTKKYKEALEDINKAIKINPTNTDLLKMKKEIEKNY